MLAKALAISVLLFSSAIVWLWLEYDDAFTEPVVLEWSRIIEINKGDSFTRVTHKLIEQNIAVKPLWFKLIAYKNKVSKQLKAGEYELKVGLTMPEILALFVEGKSRQYAITFPEGWNFKQIIQQLQNNPYLIKTLGTKDFESIMVIVGSDYKNPEGLFFPDTYFFDKNTTDLSLLKMAYHKMQLTLNAEWEKRAKELPLETAYQALILASIIEKEAGVGVERVQIAGVFTRRLKNGMRLQADPTVIYGMGDAYKGNVRYKDLRSPTPYNTYVIKGLPPTPIAMPGKAAIQAALHPAKSKSLYFVAKGNGSHYFSATLREHNNAVNKFRKKK